MDTASLEILDIDELLSLTRWSLDQGNFDQALIYNKHAMERENAEAEVYKLGGKIYAQLGLFEHAKKSFKIFLDTTSEALTETFQYGMVHYDNNEIKEAISIWTEILQKEEKYPPALFYLALALANNGQTDDAIHHLNQLISSIAIDNMYFERGRELLRAIEQNKPSPLNDSDSDENWDLAKYSNDKKTIN
ncbi:MAG: tetratricopeptide repeat protein [Gammaproteobacteria bacterium]|nr:tetratricopeptide repeat protein [Gammaproteobacteria bacterium]